MLKLLLVVFDIVKFNIYHALQGYRVKIHHSILFVAQWRSLYSVCITVWYICIGEHYSSYGISSTMFRLLYSLFARLKNVAAGIE